MNDNNKSDNSPQSWLGTRLSDIYNGDSPWNFATSPVIPLKYHHILYELPVTLSEPPGPHYNANPKHWDEFYVQMPYSPKSLFLVEKNDEKIVKQRWEVICEALSKPINSCDDLENAIRSYNNNLPKLAALQRFFNSVCSEEDSKEFFSEILPGIIKLCLSLPELVPGSIPLLTKNHCKSLSLSQLQIASLLANGFLCTFIWRKDSTFLPRANFLRLFTADQRAKRQSCISEKLKCILHYFKRVLTKHPVGVLTFERKYIQRRDMPRWDTLENNLGNTKVHINSAGTIEDGAGFLQADFANKKIGGGVLGYGCVQEEIRFVICPELLISGLFVEELGDSEAVVIHGAERYSNYSGYSDNFKWAGNVNDDTPFDDYGRRKTSITAIDAIRFNRAKDQYHCSVILRELNKAFVGFSSREKSNLAPVATGNWGCGAFKGDPNLKSLVQLMACSAANRDLVYYSFGDVELRDRFYNMNLFLANNRVTVCQLWRYLCQFCVSEISPEKLYSFIQQCHFDMKSQPTLKQFLSFNAQKRKPDSLATPSTSVASTHETTVTKKQSPSKVADNDEDDVKPSGISRRNKFVIVKKNVTEKESVKTVDSDEIINLIDLMDGASNNSKQKKENEEVNSEQTLLSEIDKLKASTSTSKPSSDDVEILMEVDGVDYEPKPITNFIEEKKKKITDYFKMTTHKYFVNADCKTDPQ